VTQAVAFAAGGAWYLPRERFQDLLDILLEDGRKLIGPTVADGAVAYEEIAEVADLPRGWRDEQKPGSYKLTRRDDERLFGYVVGPTSWKRHTYPARVATTIARYEKRENEAGEVVYRPANPEIPKLAFLGARACELAALAVHDRVFLGGPYIETDYQLRRRAAIVVAVQCTTSASTCFCTSMGTGPEVRAGAGHDLVLTELDDGYVMEAGTPTGADIVGRLQAGAASMEQSVAAVQAVAATRTRIGNPLETAGLRDRLMAKLDHPRWAEVANRCITCGNCTLACPTCFCTSVTRSTDLGGTEAVNERVWDSCFSPGFARVAGGDFRSQPKHRYRQWLTHKFATWWDQFGSSGCVGCGRCITWCPVGIDVREELDAIAPAEPNLPPPKFEPVADDRQSYATARITFTRPETHDTTTLRLAGLDAAHVDGRPGQFVMVGLPNHPAAAISVSRYLPPDGLELTIRAAGPATAAITALPVGATVGIRGPVGAGWPVDPAYGKDVVVVTGGTGLAPLRPLLDRFIAHREQFGAIRLYYGARTAQDMLFTDELERWDTEGVFEVTCRWLSKHRSGGGAGAGRSTVSAIHQASWDGANAVAYVCGPERMMEATSIALAGRGIARDRVWVTLERHMECGLGFCGHCQMGRFFICKDGPVFRLSDLGEIFGKEGI
jgi:NAD(P)H-flavin reductase/formate hydrogenlyase subunit 6/NADH:ubiquinone oxidoreductase subunit I